MAYFRLLPDMQRRVQEGPLLFPVDCEDWSLTRLRNEHVKHRARQRYDGLVLSDTDIERIGKKIRLGRTRYVRAAGFGGTVQCHCLAWEEHALYVVYDTKVRAIRTVLTAGMAEPRQSH